MSINCHLPIKLRIVGELDDAQLEQLGRTLARTLRARLTLARETVAHHPLAIATREEAREPFDPTRVDDASGSYLIPSYQLHAGPVSLRLNEAPGRRPQWTILKAVNFHARVGPFLDFIESLDPTRTLDGKVLYIDIFTQRRWVTLWLIQVNRDYTLSELEGEVFHRALDLNKVTEDQILAYGLGTDNLVRGQLIELDESHRVAQNIPSLALRNATRLVGAGPTSDIMQGGWALFAGMVLPKVELGDVAAQLPQLRVPVRLKDLSFLVQPEVFYRHNYIEWADYVREMGETKAELRLQPVEVAKKVHVLTLQYLTEDAVLIDVSREAGFNADNYFGRLFVLNSSGLDKFPAAARGKVEVLTDDTTRRLDDAVVVDMLPPGCKAAYAYTVLPVDDESVAAARYRPIARSITPQLLSKLDGDEESREWHKAFLSFLYNNFEINPPETRPVGGIVFEYVLEELEKRGQFDALFDKAESSGSFGVKQQLVRLSLATRYAQNKRVQDLLAWLQKKVLAGRENLYFPNLGEMWLERNPDMVVKVGQALGDTYSLYIFEHKSQRLKPARIPDFKDALIKEREALIGKIFRKEDTHTYDQEEFLRTVTAAAVQRMHLTEDDFEKITIQRSIRITKIEEKTVEALSRYFITFEFVERVKGETWEKVSREITEIEDDFEARLIYWATGRAGEMWEKVGLVIMVVGLLLIGWEVGLVVALVDAAGGATAVLVSIAISELIYVIRVVFGNAELTLAGFLEAALDGYLMALGFRGVSLLGRLGAKMIGTETLKETFGGWVAEKLFVGVVGGAGTAALTTFTHDLINIATGEGGWSSWRTYVRNMAIGAAVGIAIEFVGMPVMKALGKTALETVGNVKELVQLIKAEGISSVRWTALMTQGLSNLRQRLGEFMDQVAADGFVKAMSERLTEVAQEMGSRFVSERVLELAEVQLSQTAGEGLENLLAAAELNPQKALNLFNALAANPQEAAAFLEFAQTLDQSAVRRVLSIFAESDIPQIQEQVKLLLASGPARQSLEAFIDLIWANRDQVLQRGNWRGVYRYYSRATEANPLTRTTEEYLDDIDAIVERRPPGTLSNVQDNDPLAGFHRFERAGANLQAVTERVYLNVKADYATEVMGYVVQDIVDNTQVAGVEMAKLTGPRAISGRADGIVIYVDNQEAVQAVLEKLNAYRQAHPDHFLTSTPHITNPVAPGVSVGAEPIGSNLQISFGRARAEAIFKALDESNLANETRQQFRDRVMTNLARRGINPEAPQTNLPQGGTP